jgi:hypothetical protein
MSELERSLAASWDLDTLAVYADHLQQRGDPRGELMALDLNPAPEDKGWKAQRQALLVAWLGEALAARAGHLVQHGFIHAARQDRFHPPDLLDGPLGGLVRSCTLRVQADTLERFASRPRPWLTGLTLENLSSIAFSDPVRDALLSAAPNLQELLLLRRPAFNTFMHPRIRRIYVERGSRVHHHSYTVDVPRGVEVKDLYPSWDARGPRVLREELDLALDAVDETPDTGRLQAQYGALFTDGDSLPALLPRLRSAGLITLEGPMARLTRAGRILRNKEAHLPPRARVPPLDSAKWVLWAEYSAAAWEEVEMLGPLGQHAWITDRWLSLAPLSKEAQDTLVAWRHFLQARSSGGWRRCLARPTRPGKHASTSSGECDPDLAPGGSVKTHTNHLNPPT